MQKHPVVAALGQASKGLLWPSETDAPLEPFLWKGAGDKLSPERVRELAGAEEGAPVEVLSLEDLLETIPSEDLPKFQKLAETIRQHLSDVRAYKVGDAAERDVTIVGKTQNGKLAGLETSVVET